MALKILDCQVFGDWGSRQGFPVWLNCLRTCSIDQADLKHRDMHAQCMVARPATMSGVFFFGGGGTRTHGFDISDGHIFISASQVLGPQASSIMPDWNGSFVFSWLG